MDANTRVAASERFLNTLIHAFDLASQDAFRLRGEQIDGSFVLNSVTCLVEAKWQASRSGNRDLAAFNDRVGTKAAPSFPSPSYFRTPDCRLSASRESLCSNAERTRRSSPA